jgi:hypothetical protein
MCARVFFREDYTKYHYYLCLKCVSSKYIAGYARTRRVNNGG